MVVNCNFQRLDGPVRGNTKTVQELAARFTGAGWNVIKCLWGRSWDPLFAADSTGALAARLSALTDGDEQRLMTASGDVVRAELFNTPELAALVAHERRRPQALTDDVGGHDPVRIHAAYSAAVAHKGQPTVILARSIKLRPRADLAGRNATHGKKKADDSALHYMRDTIGLGFTDEDLDELPYIMPEDRSKKSRTCSSDARPSVASCRSGARPRLTCPCRRPRPTWNLTRAAASNPSAPRWPSCASCAT